MYLSALLLCVYFAVVYSACGKADNVSFCEVNYDVGCNEHCAVQDITANDTFWKVLKLWDLKEKDECAGVY